MELRDIEYFTVVAEHGHLGRAAEALGLSTPALSKSLRRLEKELQAKLVTRTPKGVELTAEGSALLTHVRPLRLSLHDIAREIAGLSEGRSGHLRLGSGMGAGDCLLPMAFGSLFSHAPGVSVAITVGSNPALVPALRSGKLDLVLMTLAAPPYEGIVQEHLFEDEFVVYASADHLLARHAPVEVAELAKEAWALPALDGWTSKWLHRALEDKGLAAPNVSLVGGHMQIRLQAIGSSRLLGIAPRRIVREVASRLHLAEIPVKELAWNCHVGIAYRKGAFLSPVARRFIEILRTTAKETGQ